MQSGGLCVAGPGGTSLPRISPRIRALQDRLMDSLPADGAWDCLSPAQRNAILSLHAARLAAAEEESSEHGDNSGKNRKSLIGLSRYGRSRSYDDRLESETDDSGVRGLGSAGGGSTSNSHNSHEDDSSDPGVKRNGRFTKAISADRVTKRDNKTPDILNRNAKNKHEVTNGFGNVNRIISKQINKNSNGAPAVPSNITLDCRNVAGEKRRRCRLDVGGVFKEPNNNKSTVNNSGSPKRTGEIKQSQSTSVISRKNILQKYDDKLHSVKEMKESPSSEEYDSGVNFKGDDSLDEYIKDRQNHGCEFDPDLDSLRTPRSDSTGFGLSHKNESRNIDHTSSVDRFNYKNDGKFSRKPYDERESFSPDRHRGMNFDRSHSSWDRQVINKREKSKSKERDFDQDKKKGMKSNGEPLKSNLKMNYGAKLNSSFDYRTNLNKDPFNKYSSNWNSIILNNEVPIKQSANQMAIQPRESRFTKNYNASAFTKSTGNLAGKSINASKKTEISWLTNEAKIMGNNPNDKFQNRKYCRSKSLDRKYLDDSTDEESDFEARRRNERVRRHTKLSSEWDIDKPKENEKIKSKSRDRLDGPRAHFDNNPTIIKPKAKSAWDLTDQNSTASINDDFDGLIQSGFRSRSDMRSKWKNDESSRTFNKNKDFSNDEFTEDFNLSKWKRRSCDFEVDCMNTDDFNDTQIDRPGHDFDRKRWYRRSCDLDLDYDLHYPRPQQHQRDKSMDLFKTRYDFDFNDDRRGARYPDQFSLKKEKPSNNEKRSKSRQMDTSEAQRMRMEEETMKNIGLEYEFDRRLRLENENGRRSKMDDDALRRYRLDAEMSRRYMIENDIARRYYPDFDPNRRNRLEDHTRAKTSMGHYERDKRERSRTPHALRGKLRLIKQILFF